MKARWLPVSIVVGVGISTIVAGSILYRASVVNSRPRDQVSKAQPGSEEHVRGDRDAPVTIEEFGDLECPPCGALAPIIKQLEVEYRGKIRVVFRHFPLVTHPHSRAAAIAAEAAGLQGHFWEMHDVLYQQQGSWSKTPDPLTLFTSYARVLGLDPERFERDRISPAIQARITADQARAKSLNVDVTPSVFVNGQAVTGPALNQSGLRAAIDAALAKKSNG